jgi:hypothetical protein
MGLGGGLGCVRDFAERADFTPDGNLSLTWRHYV